MRFEQYINGEWMGAVHGGTWDLINPATEEVIQRVPFGGRDDAEAAIDAASAAFPAWSRRTPYERAGYLIKAAAYIGEHVNDFARITTEESGKPLRESAAEWRSSTNYLQFFAEEGKRLYGRIIPAMNSQRRLFAVRQPIGVVGTITAWNFPIYNVMRAVGAALAAGCTVVTRPSEYTPRTAMLIAAALEHAGLPPGVFNLINGEPEAMGQAMLGDPRVRKIHFTGSTRVGKLLMDGASETVTQLSLEMGGNAPVIVMPDVRDVRTVARRSVQWKYRNAGQVCVSPQRFYVHSSLAEEFVEQVVESTRKTVLGNGLNENTDVGPMINGNQRDRVEALVQQSVGMGAQVLAGGARAPMERGYFYQPTVVTHISNDMPLYNQEIFGPVMPIIPFDDPDGAIAMANDTHYGLTAFVQTNDLYSAIHLSEKLEFGMICINDWLPATPEAPFVGVKQSGIGAESGTEGVQEYTELKTVFVGGVQ